MCIVCDRARSHYFVHNHKYYFDLCWRRARSTTLDSWVQSICVYRVQCFKGNQRGKKNSNNFNFMKEMKNQLSAKKKNLFKNDLSIGPHTNPSMIASSVRGETIEVARSNFVATEYHLLYILLMFVCNLTCATCAPCHGAACLKCNSFVYIFFLLLFLFDSFKPLQFSCSNLVVFFSLFYFAQVSSSRLCTTTNVDRYARRFVCLFLCAIWLGARLW